MENARNFVFWEFGLKILVLKIISSHTNAFLFLNFNAFDLILNVFQKLCFFLKIWWVSAYFDRSILFFDRSKIFKFDSESLCLFRSIEADFRSIETRETGFLKRQIGLFKVTFSNSFSTFLSLRVGCRLHHQFFVIFLQDFCKVFVLEGR